MTEPGYKNLAGKYIIFIDDDPIFSQIIRQILNKYQINLIHYLSKTDLMEQCNNEILTKADILISDVRLKDGDGYEVVQWVREIVPDLPVLIISGYLDTERFGHHQAQFGNIDCLSKPFAAKDVLDKVLDLSTPR